MNNKILIITSREFLTRAKSKFFIIGTLLFPVLLILLFSGFYLFNKISQPSTKYFKVVDQSGLIFNELSTTLQDTLKNGLVRFKFSNVDIAQKNIDDVVKNLQNKIRAKEIYGYMIIPKDIVDNRNVKYAAINVGDFEDQRYIRNAISEVIKNIRFTKLGLDLDKIQEEINNSRVHLVSTQVTKSGEVEKSGASSFLLTYIMTYIMFLMIMIYGQMVMRSVISEKNERITESIVSAVKPFELMAGKIFGICLLGLIQLVVFGSMIFIMVEFGEPITAKFGMSSGDLMGVIKQIHFTPFIFFTFLFYFIIGFVFYSSICAAIGAMVNTPDEGQQFLQPIMILIIVSFIMVLSVVQNPNTAMAFWGSLIPFFTPIVMFGRITATDPALPSGFFLSIIIMLLSTGGLLWLSAKIYRVGILMYGKKPSIKEIIKWIKY